MSAPAFVLPPSPVEYVPLASVEDMREGPYAFMLTNSAPPFVERQMLRASRAVEARCNRRLAPFGPITQTERAEGVASDGYPAADAGLSMMGSLQLSRARAYGDLSGMVRDIWLDQHAPRNSELWAFWDVAVTVTGTFGGNPVGVPAGVEGPYADTGQLRLPLGTYCPPGSTIAVTYCGGYVGGIPDDLVQATLMQAARLLILGTEPQSRNNLTTADLDAEITALLAPYARI